MEQSLIADLRQLPIEDFLARLGYQPVKGRGNELWYHAPYRDDRTPSFRVNVEKLLWYDFGLGKGGDIFTLAGELVGSEDFMEQVKFIAETANMPMTVPEVSIPTFPPKPSEPAFEGVEAVASLSADGLSGGTGYPLRCRITLLLPTELRDTRQTVFHHRFPECGGWL